MNVIIMLSNFKLSKVRCRLIREKFWLRVNLRCFPDLRNQRNIIYKEFDGRKFVLVIGV